MCKQASAVQALSLYGLVAEHCGLDGDEVHLEIFDAQCQVHVDYEKGPEGGWPQGHFVRVFQSKLFG